MEQRPKRRGDRFDGYWLRDEAPALGQFMAYLMPNRTDNEAHINLDVDCRPLDAFLAKKNAGRTQDKYTYFHIFLAAAVKCFVLRPRMNRFISGNRLYMRDHISVSFVVKKKFEDKAEEGLAYKRYGEALPSTCRLSVRPAGQHLWTALFCYQSEYAFQVHDWLELHKRSGRDARQGHFVLARHIPPLPQVPERRQGRMVGGSVSESWDAMLETWLWLIKEYYSGRPTEEAVASLERVERLLRDEEYDQNVADLLASCEMNLQAVLPEPEVWDAKLAEAQEKQNFGEAAVLRLRWAEAALWETEHVAKWQACLSALRNAWSQAHPETDPE